MILYFTQRIDRQKQKERGVFLSVFLSIMQRPFFGAAAQFFVQLFQWRQISRFDTPPLTLLKLLLGHLICS